MANISRKTVYNHIVQESIISVINPRNIELTDDYVEYLSSIDRSKGTIKQYKANLYIFWCWNVENNNNKFFVDLTKRDITKFQNHAINVWKWSPKRIRTVKATLSSLSNYIESMLDDEFKDFRPIINKIQSPSDNTVREKTVFTDDELQKLLDYLESNKQYMKACLLSIAMNGGRRKSELPRFKVKYFAKENLICDGALYKTPERVTTKGRGSLGKQLYIYTLAKPVQKYLDLWLAQRKELGIRSEWLFPRHSGGKWRNEPIATYQLDSWARSFGEYLDCPFYWHSLRHYFTTKLKSYNIPDGVIQDMIGWDSADMVNIYDDTPNEEKFEKYFGSDGIRTTKKTTLEEL